jgi:hypothetical protein
MSAALTQAGNAISNHDAMTINLLQIFALILEAPFRVQPHAVLLQNRYFAGC